LDWVRRTNLLAPELAWHHSGRFHFVGIRQVSSVSCPCAWPSNVTRPRPWCAYFSNPGHVRQNMGKAPNTGFTLFVPPVGHIPQCTKLTTDIQILWVPLSYATNCTKGNMKVMPPIIVIKCNCNNNEIYEDDSHVLQL
jgi:hypothetical protein